MHLTILQTVHMNFNFNIIKTISLILIFLNMNSIYSQNIEAHTWKNRVLLVFTDDLNNPLYQNQIIELQGHENELKSSKIDCLPNSKKCV